MLRVCHAAGVSNGKQRLQDHETVGDFLMQQPESKRSVRLSEVRSLAWAQLQHSCRLEIRVLWKMQVPQYKQVRLCGPTPRLYANEITCR